MTSRPVILFDVFRTLLAFDGDHVDATTFPWLARWLAYRGVAVDGRKLEATHARATADHLAAAPGSPPDVDVVEVWRDALRWVADAEPDDRLLHELCLTWRQVTTRSIGPWPGTDAMLAACAGVRIAVASNTQRAYTEAELGMFGLYDRFAAVVFSSDVGAVKPDPTVLLEALARAGGRADRTVYIGDDPYDDVVAGQRAGIPVVLLERDTPVPEDVRLPEPLARVSGDQPVEAVRVARRHLGVDA